MWYLNILNRFHLHVEAEEEEEEEEVDFRTECKIRCEGAHLLLLYFEPARVVVPDE